MIKNKLEKWNALKLSLWCKGNVIRVVVAPQFNYFSAMLPLDIPDRIFKEYEKIIEDFFWEKKKPRLDSDCDLDWRETFAHHFVRLMCCHRRRRQKLIQTL